MPDHRTVAEIDDAVFGEKLRRQGYSKAERIRLRAEAMAADVRKAAPRVSLAERRDMIAAIAQRLRA